MAIQKDMRLNDLTNAALALKQQPQPAAATKPAAAAATKPAAAAATKPAAAAATKPAAAAATKPAAAATTKPAAAATTKPTGSAVVATTTAAKPATKPASQVANPTNSVRGNAMAGISAAAATANAAATAVIQTTIVDTKNLNTAVNSAMKANAAGTVAKEQVKNAVAQNNKAIAGANLIVGAKPSVWLKALKAIAANFVSSFAAKAKNDAKLMDTLGFVKDSKTNKFILKVPKKPSFMASINVSAAPAATGITKPINPLMSAGSNQIVGLRTDLSVKPVIATATKKVGFDAEFADFDAEFADDVNFNGSQRAATIAGIVTAMEEEDDLNFFGAERAATIGGVLSAMKPVESKKISTSPVRTFQVVAPLTAGSGCVYNPTTKGYLAKQAFLPKVGDIVTGRIVEIDRTVPSIGGKGMVKVKQQGIYYTIRPFSQKPKAVLAQTKVRFDGEEELNFILQPSAATTSYAIWIPLNKLQEVVPPSLKQMIGFDAEFADADGDDDFDYEPDFVTRDLSFDGEDELNADGEELDMFDEEMENASGEDLFDSVEISEVDESVGADGEEYEEVIIQKIIE